MKHAYGAQGIEAKMLAILAERGDLAIETEEFKRATGHGSKPFWCAVARLEVKGAIFRWMTETYHEYFTLASRAGSAYYLAPVQFVRSPFEPPIQTLIRRSAPFVTLTDADDYDQPTISVRNRYANAVA